MYFNIITLIVMISAVMAVPLSKRRTVKSPKGHNVQDGVYISCNRPGVFALTFDDGPYMYSYELATRLHDQGIKATFFTNGKNWVDVENESVDTIDGEKTYMQVIKHYKDMGHQIASHTYEHRELPGLSESQISFQMNEQSNIIYEAAGVRPAIMRPPAGAYDDNTIRILHKLGYAVVNWDIDTQDWATHNFEQEKAAYMIMDNDEPSTLGHIALEHEVYDQTVNNFVPWAVDYVKSKGYEFVTVADCLGIQPYQ